MARVLVAEADRRIGGFIAGILADFGHEVTLCADPREADARLAAEPIDVFLSDYLLRTDARLGRNWQARGVPTFTLTGRPVPAGRGDETQLGLIDKPFRFADLRCILDAVAACGAKGSARLRNAA